MSAERWARVKALLQAALERPAAERGDFVAAAVAGDESVRREVESLLGWDTGSSEPGDGGSALAADLAGSREDRDARMAPIATEHIPGAHLGRESSTATFGPYRLLRRLGEGGMGAVWLAQQEQPIRRTVALKVVRPGLNSRDMLLRFQSERQALAILNHPHIARVLDAGVTDDAQPYFVMECVEGSPITHFADEQALTLVQRLELFLQVCDAVQHAHQKGLLHRDLKPGNILVSQQDGHPVAKVIDFGIAKAVGQHLTGETLQTAFGALVGTPEYMSPEQAGLVEAAVDTRSDIYSLGLVLYELLVGRPAFDPRELRRQTLLEALRVIREVEPPRLSARLRALDRQAADEVARRRRTEARRLLRRLEGDLEWITARAIDREPARRYASVSELRADIRRFLHGEPVLAGPPSTLYRLRKLARRHRAAAVAASMIAVAVALSAVVSAWALVRAVRAEDRMRRQLVTSLVSQGMQKVDAADSLTGLVYLVRALEQETDPDRLRSHRTRIGETLKHAPRLVGMWDGGSHVLALSTGGLVATAVPGVVKVRDLATGAPRTDLHQAGAIDGEFSPDGATLAIGSEDGRVRLWDPANGRMIREFTLPDHVVDVAFSHDGGLVSAIGMEGAVSVWDARRGTLWFTGRHDGEGRQVIFSHGGARLATAGRDGVRVWRVATGTASGQLLRHDGTRGVRAIAFSADDAWLASAGWDGTARLWGLETMRQIGEAMRHDGAVTGVTFAGSHLLVTTSLDRTTRTWRVPETSAVGPVRQSATAVARPPDVSRGLVIASPTLGGAVDLWSVDGDRVAPSLPHGGQAIVRFDPTGRFLVTTADDGLARTWDLAPALGTAPRITPDEWDVVGQIVASPHGGSVAVSSASSLGRGAVRIFDVATGAPMTPAMRFEAADVAVVFSPDGRRLLTASGAGEVRLWDARTGEPLTAPLREPIPLRLAAFSPDGESFVVAGGRTFRTPSGARVRRAIDGAPRTGLLPHDGGIYGAWFSHDGRRLFTVGEGGQVNVKIWDVATGQLALAIGDAANVHAAARSADGATVFTGGPDQWVRAWNAASGAPRPPAIKVAGGVSSLDVTRDGARLLSGTAAGDVRLLDLAHAGQVVSAMRHLGYVFQSRFSPDGALAFTSASDGTLRLWDGRTGEPLSPRLPAEPVGPGATFLADGNAVAWGGTGVFVDELAIESRPVEPLGRLAESLAGRTLSSSGTEIALAADQIQRRVSASDAVGRLAAPSPDLAYERAAARIAWRRGAFEEVVARLAPLGVRRALQWPDFMRLAGAYAARGRWKPALDELRRQRARWPSAPELLYMEAVALARLGDGAGGTLHCREALRSTRATRHPERAYWTARACLVARNLSADDLAEVDARIQLANPHLSGTLGQAALRGAMLLRAGHPRQAFERLQSAVLPQGTGRAPMLLVASAAAHSGLETQASTWLARAAVVATPTRHVHVGPWLDAEADGLREEALNALRRSRARRGGGGLE